MDPARKSEASDVPFGISERDIEDLLFDDNFSRLGTEEMKSQTL